jgi:hypothetical protein
MPARMSAHNNNDERALTHAPLCPPHFGRAIAFAVVLFFLSFLRTHSSPASAVSWLAGAYALFVPACLFVPKSAPDDASP